MKYSQIPAEEFKFYTRTWSPSGKPVATVVFVHGFAEHIDRYDHVFKEIAAGGIEVFGFDGRGFGQSATDKTAGVNGGWKQQILDVDFHVRTKKQADLPQFLWGHSMGGALALKYALDGPHKSQLAGVISSAPLIQQPPAARSNFILVKAGSLAANLLPDQIIPIEVPVTTCTRDPVKIKEGEADQYLRPFGSLRGVSDMLAGGETLLLPENTSRFQTPVLCIHGTGDLVTFHEATRKFFEAIPSKDKTHKEYPDVYHEAHNDLGREIVIEDCKQWILARSGDSSSKL